MCFHNPITQGMERITRNEVYFSVPEGIQGIRDTVEGQFLETAPVHERENVPTFSNAWNCASPLQL